jgi:hypothetical protein
MPVMIAEVSVGEGTPCVRVWRKTRARCSWFRRLNSSFSARSSVVGRGRTAHPLRFSWTLGGQVRQLLLDGDASAVARVVM